MNTKILKANKKNILIASKEIINGNIIAFPTETIYGLGANAFNEKAILKIFKVKNRPLDNPLIVHIAQLKDINLFATKLPKKAELLIKKFWPGPLTIVLKKKQNISNKITAGLNSIAIRMPSNKIALELINNSYPLVAPSANSFGKPSPSKAIHVYEDLKNKIPIILDGGKCHIGIESTVIDFSCKMPTILRPGKITKENIEKIIGKVNVADNKTKIKSPGMKYRHYSPKAKVILFDKLKNIKLNNNCKIIIITKNNINTKHKKIIYKNNINLAKNLYSWFRELDSKNYKIIYIQKPSNKNLGTSILNRLEKASSKK
jgi:L-threonylcarbamoyladenylate synthase